MKVTLDVGYPGRNRGGVQEDIDQRAEVLRVGTLAKVQSETVIRRCPGGFFQKAGETGTRDESFRIGKGRVV